MRSLAKAEGFTLIELLVVVAILGILSAIVVPNVGRLIGARETEGRNMELANVQSAITAVMAELGLSSIAPVLATNKMDLFPDVTTVLVPGAIGKGSIPGVRLFDHDSDHSDRTDGPTVRFVTTKTTKCKYLAQANGTVQFASKADSTVGTLDESLADCS